MTMGEGNAATNLVLRGPSGALLAALARRIGAG
jgi:hypothetical protein